MGVLYFMSIMPQQSWFALYTFTHNFEWGILTGSIWVRYPVWVPSAKAGGHCKRHRLGYIPSSQQAFVLQKQPWDSVHLTQLAGAGWTRDTNQVSRSPHPLEFSNGNLGERISISLVVAFLDVSSQVLSVCRSALWENKVCMQTAARQSKVPVESLFLQNPVGVE